MKCAELMKTSVECCLADDDVESAAERMARRHIGFLPVCDGAGAIVGAITDRDLAIHVLAEHRTHATKVSQVMCADPIYCSPDDDLEIAEALMRDFKKSRIICVDADKRPVGVISLSDIVQIEDPEVATELLGTIASRETPQMRLID